MLKFYKQRSEYLIIIIKEFEERKITLASETVPYSLVIPTILFQY